MTDDRDKKLERLFEVLQLKKTMLIVMQDYPDPDAIASAAALKVIANSNYDIACTLGHGGAVGRAENKALVRYLGLRFQSLKKTDIKKYDVVAMVDTQPGTGNNSLGNRRLPDIVIDHHPLRSHTRKVAFYDVRKRYGATSTILYEYLTRMQIEPSVQLATALVYGIRSDTNDLSRLAIEADEKAYLSLYSKANRKMLARIETERLPRGYFRILAIGLKNARTYGKCIVCSLGRIDNPDMVSEIADLLLRNEESSWALCFGIYRKQLLLSVRTSEKGVDAGKLMEGLVNDLGTGGGHRELAGGQIKIGNVSSSLLRRTQDNIIARFLELTNTKKSRGRSLVVV